MGYPSNKTNKKKNAGNEDNAVLKVIADAQRKQAQLQELMQGKQAGSIPAIARAGIQSAQPPKAEPSAIERLLDQLKTTTDNAGNAIGNAFDSYMTAIAKANGASDPNAWYSGWLQTPAAFDDGYDFGDVTRSILSTGVDVGADLVAGTGEMVESLADGVTFFSANLAKYLGAEYYFKFMDSAYNWISGEDRHLMEDYWNGAYSTAVDFVQSDWIPTAEIQDNLMNDIGYNWEKDSVVGEKLDNVVQSVPPIVASYIAQAHGIPWWLVTYGNAFGGQADSALNQGATPDEAFISAAITAFGEVVTEKISGAILPGAGKSADDLISKAVAKIPNKATQSFVKFFLDGLFESIEEVLADDISTIGEGLTFRSDEDMWDLLFSEEAIKRKAEAALSGWIMGQISNVSKTAKAHRLGRSTVSGLTANEEAVVKAEYEARLAEAEKAGGKVNKGKIYDKVVETLKRGGISIETIEKVLGGETYTAYESASAEKKSLTEKRRALEEQIFSLLSNNNRSAQDDAALDRAMAEYNSVQAQLKNVDVEKARQNLFTAVDAVTKAQNDTYLRESYNESARSVEDFKVDPKKYKSKKHQAAVDATIQSALRAGMNNTRRVHEMVSFLAKISADTGLVFDLSNHKRITDDYIRRQTAAIRKLESIPENQRTEAQNDMLADMRNQLAKVKAGVLTVDGVNAKNTVTLNLDSNKPLNRVTGHEITHSMESVSSYNALRDSLIAYAKSKGVDVEGKLDEYRRKYRGTQDANPEREMIADMIGDYLFTDEDFIQHLTKNRNLFQRVYDEVKYLLKLATSGSKEARELERVKHLFDKAYQQMGESDASAQYSISDDATAPVAQTFTSAATSLPNQLPALFKDKNAVFVSGGTNVDIGAGRTPRSEAYLSQLGVSYYPFDPYNRTKESNKKTLDWLMDGNRADTVTCANVLNVIDTKEARSNVILEAAKALKPNGVAYFTTHEGSTGKNGKVAGDGIARQTGKDAFQNYRKTADYMDEIREWFGSVERKGSLIIAKEPMQNLPNAVWELSPGEAVRYSFSSMEGLVEASDNLNTAGTQKTTTERDSALVAKINESLTMQEAKQMIQRAFVLGGIKEWYDGKYQNGDEWLKGEGAEDVAMIIENEYSLQSAYIDRIPGLLNEDFYLTDVLEAYSAGTLTGKVKKNTERINIADGVAVADPRFYAPKEIENAKELYGIANQKITNGNRDEVNRARAQILLYAHNKGAAETLGITQSELNKKLRSWGGYSAKAREISMRINAGAHTANRWTGIESLSWLNKATVTDEDVMRMVKSVEGNGDRFQNNYIARTMLALDTHIDWSWLNFKFDTYQGVNSGYSGNPPSGKCNGYYDNKNRLIHVKRDAPNTVAHEMGHALDYQWGRDLGYEYTCLTEIVRNTENISGEAKAWFDHFKEFADSLVASSDTRSAYSMDIKETFARFVAKFVEWTEQIGTGRTTGYESGFYNDRFTGAQFVQFARLLQEKSAIDAKGLTGNKLTDFQSNGMSDPRSISTDGDAQYSLSEPPKKADADHLDAVYRGDMETAQRMVDEAAKKAGYPDKVYHGTMGFGFTTIQISGIERSVKWSPFFATSNPNVAATYSGSVGATTIGNKKRPSKSIGALRNEAASRLKDMTNYSSGVIENKEEADYFIEKFGGLMDSDTLELMRSGKQGAYATDRKVFAFVPLENGFNLDDYAEQSGNYGLYANTDNFLVVDGAWRAWDDIKSQYGSSTRTIAENAFKQGYRGVKIENIYDTGMNWNDALDEDTDLVSDVYIFFFPQEQVKSADPVTYDDSGNVIPLSQRFNPNINDIRHSLTEIGERFEPASNVDVYGYDLKKYGIPDDLAPFADAVDISAADDIAPVQYSLSNNGEQKPVVDHIQERMEKDLAKLRERYEPQIEKYKGMADSKEETIVQLAWELLSEFQTMEKGKKVSWDLGYLLDHTIKEPADYRSLDIALKNIRDNPLEVVNPRSKAERFARQMLERQWQETVDFASDLEQEYRQSIEELATQANLELDAAAGKPVAPIAQNSPAGSDVAPVAPTSQEVTEEKKAPTIDRVMANDGPRAKRKKSSLTMKLRNTLVDKGSVIDDISIKTGNRELIAKYKSINNAAAKAQHMIGNGDAKAGVKALTEIQKNVKKVASEADFDDYMYNRLNVDRMTMMTRYPGRHDIPVFGPEYSAAESRANVQAYEAKYPEFRGLANDVYAFVRNNLNMMIQEGLITQETAKLWGEMYPHYIPIERASFQDKNTHQDGRTGAYNPVKKLTGSEKKLRPMFTAIADQTIAVHKAIAKNRFGKELRRMLNGVEARETASTGPADGILQDGTIVYSEERGINGKVTGYDESRNQYSVQFKYDNGRTEEVWMNPDQVSQMAPDTAMDEAMRGFFDSKDLLKPAKGEENPIFTVFENGKRIEFEITPDIYDALKPTSDAMSAKIPVLSQITNARKRILTDLNPVFWLTNTPKDIQAILPNSQHPGATYGNLPNAAFQIASKGKWYREYVENGGKQQSYFNEEERSLEKEPGTAKRILTGPVRFIRSINESLEMMPRLAEYIASRKKGASIDVAMLDAARVTTDFSAAGDLSRAINRNAVPFFTASISGAAQQVRNVREAKAKGAKGIAGYIMRQAIATIPLAVINHLMWEDDEEYEELSDYVKQNYYIVGKYGDGKFIRIPKGREVAVIQDLYEQLANIVTGNADDVDLGSFAQLVMNNIAPNNPIDNNIAAPLIQAIEGETWYGDDLLPSRLQNVPAREQYDETTDAVSKWIGEMTGLSPYKINYILDQYSGGFGDVLLPMLTSEAESGTDTIGGKLLAPLADKFTVDSTMKNQNVSDFYDKVDELEVNANSQYATDKDILMSSAMNDVNSEIGSLYKLKRQVQSATTIGDLMEIADQINPYVDGDNFYPGVWMAMTYGNYDAKLPDSEKYNLARDIQREIDDKAKAALGSYQNVRISGDYATVGSRHYLKRNERWSKLSTEEVEEQKLMTNALGIGPEQYWSVKYDLSGIHSDKDENGKSISGTRKPKVIDWLNNQDLPYEAKIILYKSMYNSDNTYDQEIVSYLRSNPNISYDQMVTILKELGFEIRDGRDYS